ncbi:hypothetical protein SCUP234_12333 [Seiridium cupressi]
MQTSASHASSLARKPGHGESRLRHEVPWDAKREATKRSQDEYVPAFPAQEAGVRAWPNLFALLFATAFTSLMPGGTADRYCVGGPPQTQDLIVALHMRAAKTTTESLHAGCLAIGVSLPLSRQLCFGGRRTKLSNKLSTISFFVTFISRGGQIASLSTVPGSPTLVSPCWAIAACDSPGTSSTWNGGAAENFMEQGVYALRVKSVTVLAIGPRPPLNCFLSGRYPQLLAQLRSAPGQLRCVVQSTMSPSPSA